MLIRPFCARLTGGFFKRTHHKVFCAFRSPRSSTCSMHEELFFFMVYFLYMKKLRVAINGFGRIGRAAFRIALTKKDLEIVAINDLTEPEVLAHLLKYDSVYRRFAGEVAADEKHIIVDGKKYPVVAEKDPA